MKNADKPINPVLTQSPSLQNETSLGLTKREYFAGVALQGFLSNRWSMEFGNYNDEEKAKYAIRIADELLKQLENE